MGISFFVWPALLDAVCCAVLCFCCIWCLKTKGVRPLPWPWLPIVLAVVGIPVALWALKYNYLTAVYGIPFMPNHFQKSASLSKFLSYASDKGYLGHVLTRFACLAAAAVTPIAIFLYQRKQRRNSK